MDNNSGKKNGLGSDPSALSPDGVCGGTYTEEEANQLREVLIQARQMGWTLEKVLGMVPTFHSLLNHQHPNFTRQQVIDFIKAVWPTL